MTGIDAVVHDAAELVVGPARAIGGSTPSDRGGILDVRSNAAVAVVDGEVAAVGPTEEVTREYPPENADHAIDASGRAVVPGLVDPHTHAVFAGDRSDEFEAKIEGKSYREIAAEGGGILRTVRTTREATDGDLLSNLLGHLDTMLAHGSTTVEVKSGYGLDTETELRLLEVIDRADEKHPIDLHATFMGAHSTPEGMDTDGYVDRVVSEQLPAVAEQGVARFCDVFCEAGVFSVEQSRRVLEAGLNHGLDPKIHAEEFERVGGAQLAAALGATSADHLLRATVTDIDALVESEVVPVMLPGTAFVLGEEYADARAFLDRGAPVALATDFNPNCFSRSVPFAVSLACVGMRMTPAEALSAATANAARALDLDDGTGTLREGVPADLLVLDAPSYRHLPYRVGENPVSVVVKEGRPVVEGRQYVMTS
ncbi:imidazolonepropionase [Natronorarus salvus]|uniref:imidazolonepropionase n=1 Tax=Natronorarus salvus TaxID=3117733 RepID=UPI002F26A893